MKNKYDSNFEKGDTVTKISGKPFKNQLLVDEILEFTTNPHDPKNRQAAKLKNSETVVSLDILTK